MDKRKASRIITAVDKAGEQSWSYNKINRAACRKLAENEGMPLWIRVHWKVQADMVGQHMEYQPGELSQFFSVTQRAVNLAIESAVKFELLEPGSSSICLRMPADLAKNSLQENECSRGPRKKTQQVIELLETELANGATRSDQLREKALELASEKTFKAAKKKLGVKVFQRGGIWFTAFPRDLPKKPVNKPVKPPKKRVEEKPPKKLFRPPTTKPGTKKRTVRKKSPILVTREKLNGYHHDEEQSFKRLDDLERQNLALFGGRELKHRELKSVDEELYEKLRQ